MASGGLLALLDDLTVLMDDIAAMSKVAAKKTAGISGDDLAVNAQLLTGLAAKRELPIVWAVAKGSFKNKCLLVPAALFLSWAAPWSIVPILMLGGLFLCFEGVEKILHARKKKKDKAHQSKLIKAAEQSEADLLRVEETRIKQAIQTDLILSAEIIAIALGTVADKSFMTQFLVLCVIAVGMTVAVYGLVAGIVKLDDAGLYLAAKRDLAVQKLGHFIVRVTPGLMRVISVVGTLAMFMVGGGILVHGWHALDVFVAGLPAPKLLSETVVGVLAGIVAVACIEGVKRLRRKTRK